MSAPTAVVVGSGSGGKVVAQELAGRGCRVTVVEAARVGGECPYTACVPSKVLLLAARAGLTWAQALAAREEAVDGRDDAASVESLGEAGVELVRGRARLAGRGRVEVETADGTRTLEADVVVLATGSTPARPPVDGLDDVPVWTSVDALSAPQLPSSLVVLGGGAVGCELSQAFSGLGCAITLVETAPRLLGQEEPFVGDLLAERLRRDGVRVLLDTTAQRAAEGGDGVVLTMEDGSEVTAARVLVAGGRTPSTHDLGLDTVGVAPAEHGHLPIDERCRVTVDGTGLGWLFAVGDVTAESSYTHSANYQARVVAAHVAGEGYDADYRGVPRVVFTEPAVWCTGTTQEQARQDGARLDVGEVDLADVERGGLLGTVADHGGPTAAPGRLALLVDTDDVLVGVAAVGPDVDAWAGELGPAVREGLTATEMRDTPRGFLTWSEAVTAALGELDA